MIMVTISKHNHIEADQLAEDIREPFARVSAPEPVVEKWALWRRVLLVVTYCVLAWALLIAAIIGIFS